MRTIGRAWNFSGCEANSPSSPSCRWKAGSPKPASSSCDMIPYMFMFHENLRDGHLYISTNQYLQYLIQNRYAVF